VYEIKCTRFLSFPLIASGILKHFDNPLLVRVTTELDPKHWTARKDTIIELPLSLLVVFSLFRSFHGLCVTESNIQFVVLSTETSHSFLLLTLNVDKAETSHVCNTCLFRSGEVSRIIWWN
jgi:hypothetical protein